MRQLSPQDAQFLYMEDGDVASHVTAIAICDQSTAPDGLVRFKDIIDLIETRLSSSMIYNHKLMRMPLEIDHPYWVEDPHFDNEYHISHGHLPAPQDWRQFCIHMARFHSRPLDMARPPWEIYIVEGLGHIDHFPEGAFALVIKIHHAAVDGTSVQKFISSLMDFGPEGPPALPQTHANKRKQEKAISTQELLLRAAFNNAMAPSKIARAALRLAPGIAKAAARRMASKGGSGDSVPHTRFNVTVSPHRAFDATVFELDDFKTVRRAFKDAKINDVILAVCGGALRQYLTAKNELPSQSLIATAPINARPQSADPVGAKSDGNNISAMAVPLYTNIADPAERLKAIVRTTKSAKAGQSGLSARVMTDLTQHIPASTQALLTRALLSNPRFSNQLCNLFVSNVAGPPEPLYFCGAKVLNNFGMAPIGGGVGLFIATPSYAGQLSFNITTTRDIVPDTPFLIECIKTAFDDIKAAAARQQPSFERSAAGKRGNGARFRTRPAPKASSETTQKPKKKKKKKKQKSAKPAGNKTNGASDKALTSPQSQSQTKRKTPGL